MHQAVGRFAVCEVHVPQGRRQAGIEEQLAQVLKVCTFSQFHLRFFSLSSTAFVGITELSNAFECGKGKNGKFARLSYHLGSSHMKTYQTNHLPMM